MTANQVLEGPPGPPGPVGPAGVGFRRTYAVHDGTVNSAWHANDAAALRVTTLIDLIWKGIPGSWTPATQQDLGGKFNTAGSQKGYVLSLTTASKLRFSYAATVNGTTQTATSATLPSDLTGFNGPVWLRALADPTSGTGGLAGVAFYYSLNGSTWTQIGSLVTGSGAGPWAAGTATLYVGRSELGAGGNSITGRTYRYQVWNGSSTGLSTTGGSVSVGTLVADFSAESIDPTTFVAGTTSYSDGHSNTWVGGSSSAVAISEQTDDDFRPGSITADRVYGLSIAAISRLAWLAPRPVDLRDPAWSVATTNTDNAIGLNAAIATMDGRGGSVYLPMSSGVYLVNHPILMRSNVSLFGDQGYDQGGTDVCVIKRGTAFPETTVPTGFTTPSDSITGFTVTVGSTANFPMCSGGITLTNGIGVARIGGITFYYRGSTSTTFTNCTTNYTSVAVASGATVTCDLIWDGEPGYGGQTPGTRIQEISCDARGSESKHWWSCHAAEGSGPRRCRLFGSRSGFLHVEYPPRAIGGASAVIGPPHNWMLPGDLSLGWSQSSPGLITDAGGNPAAVGVEIYGTPFTGNGAYGRGSFKGMNGCSIGGSLYVPPPPAPQVSTPPLADIRVNGIDGILDGDHLERGGIIVGDLQPTIIKIGTAHFGQIATMPYGVHLGAHCLAADIGPLIVSRTGAIVDPTQTPTDVNDMRLVYDEVTGKKSSNSVVYAMGYKRDRTGAVSTDLVMT